MQHLSAGDLLREHMKSGTPDGNMVADMIKQGQIVPSHVRCPQVHRAPRTSRRSPVPVEVQTVCEPSWASSLDACIMQVTISLLEKAMTESGKDSFLIDGFPRNEENRSAFEQQVRVQP